MSVQLYNEGRVVGLSAYEVYVKHALSEDPNHSPASEREWLSSTIASGSSMILKIPIDYKTEPHMIDIPLPYQSRLCAANVIFANFFDGEVTLDSSGFWATKVTDYGQLISNNRYDSPSGYVGTMGNAPSQHITKLSDEKQSQLMQYIKLADGLVIQPGTWTNASNKPPQKDFSPDMSNVPRIRFLITSSITKPFYILLTGFTNRVVVTGVSGLDTSLQTSSKFDGDFLGPAAFPWSAKVVLSQPPILTYYLQQNLVAHDPNVVIHKDENSTTTSIEVKKQLNKGSNNVIISPESNEHISPVTIDASPKNMVKPGSNKVTVTPENNNANSPVKIDAVPSNIVKPGQSIAITVNNDGSVTINNTAPYISESSKYVTLDKNHVSCSFQNLFTMIDEGDFTELAHEEDIDGFVNSYLDAFNKCKKMSTPMLKVQILPILYYESSRRTNPISNIKQCYIKITHSASEKSSSGETSVYRLGVGSMSESNFMFGHLNKPNGDVIPGTDGYNAAAKSRICGITFKGTIIVDGINVDLSQLNNRTATFIDTSPLTTGIWNLSGDQNSTGKDTIYDSNLNPIRPHILIPGSYDARVSVCYQTPRDKDIQIWGPGGRNPLMGRHTLMLVATSYADGINNQLKHLCQRNSKGITTTIDGVSRKIVVRDEIDPKNVVGHHLNMTVSGTFEFAD